MSKRDEDVQTSQKDEEETHSRGIDSMTVKKVMGESTHRATMSKYNDVVREQLQLVIDDNNAAYDSQQASSIKRNNLNLSLQRTISTRNN